MAIAGGSTATNNNGVSTGGGPISNSAQWAQAIEQAGGYPQTQSNTEFLIGWAAAEGGNWNNSAAFNPINTTQQTAGSTGSINSVGVQSYNSWNSGIAATLQTLNNGYYNNITSALAAGDAGQVNETGSLNSDLKTWGTGSVSPSLYGSVLGGSSGGSSWSPAGVAAAGGVGNGTATGSSGSTAAGSGSTAAAGTGPGGLMSNCSAYKNSSAATTNCIIGGGSGLVSIGCLFNACNAKALASGLLVLGGGVLMLAGAALLFAGGKGVLGTAAATVGGYEAVKVVTRNIQARTSGVSQSDSAARKGATQSLKKTGGGGTKPRSVPADEGEF